MKPDLNNLSSLSNEDIEALYQELKPIVSQSPSDYVPHPKQLLFHQAPHNIRAMFGGNRSGKTEAGTMECWFHMSGEYPEWYPHKQRILYANRGRIVVTDYKNGGAALEEKIKKWFPRDRLDIKHSMGHIERFYVRHKDGNQSVAEVLTHEQDDDAFESWSGHWAWFDEPPPREKYIAMSRGLVDFNGRTWFTLTPLNEPWLYDEIMGKEDGRRWFIQVSIFDNPYQSKEAIENFISKMDEDSKEARVHGKFRHLAGIVYKEFDPLIHLVSRSKIKIKDEWPTWFVLDPADRRAHHGLWAKCDPLGTIYIFDELVFKGTIKDLCDRIKIREAEYNVSTDNLIRILDPNKGRTPSAVSGLTLVNEFAQHGVYFGVDANDDVTLGHLAVKEKLSWDKTKPFSTTNCPKLYFIQERTRECVRQLQSYVWDDWRGVSKGARSEKETVKDVNKDMPDCVRYLIIKDPQWYPMEGDADPHPSRAGSVTGYRN